MASPNRQKTQDLVFVSETALPTRTAQLNVRAYRSSNGTEPLAIYTRLPSEGPCPLRIHDACFTSEVLGSTKCDCKAQLDYAIDHVVQNSGLVIYLHQEGRGIGLANKIAAYALQEQGMDTVDANRALHFPDDARSYEDAAAILHDLGIRSVELLTNNPRKSAALEALGIEITRCIPIYCDVTEDAQSYIQTKIDRMGHFPQSTEID